MTLPEPDRAKILACGCAPNARRLMPDGSSVPSCVVHDCIKPAPTPDLAGREARCYCGTARPSSFDLAFFESRGPGSAAASRICGHCGYYEVAHTKRDLGHAFEPHGPFPSDTYYCGCRGWD